MLNRVVIQKNYLSTQVGVIRNDEFIRFYMNTVFSEDIQSKIIVGQVIQIVKSMDAVFVDFGGEKNGILHLKQIPENIYSKISLGTRLPVQIIKQNSGEKGHKLTGKINFCGLFFVLLPFEKGINISKKIKNSDSRDYLKKIVEDCVCNRYGVIIRTEAQQRTQNELIQDLNNLIRLTEKFIATKDCFEKGTVIYQDPPFYMKVIRDSINRDDKFEIICDCQDTLNQIRSDLSTNFCQQNIEYKLCKEPEGIFAIYGLQKKVRELFNRKIWLKNGGNLIIDYTEAMTVIDVNSAKSASKKTSNKTILELNMLAIRACILQIILRNLSGMIVVDLVEMQYQQDKIKIYEHAKETLKYYGDRITKVYPITELGILQISRSKKYQSLPQQVYSECCVCSTPLSHKSNGYIAIELENKIKEISLNTELKDVFIKCRDKFYSFLSEDSHLERLSLYYGINIFIDRSTKQLNNEFEISFIKDND